MPLNTFTTERSGNNSSSDSVVGGQGEEVQVFTAADIADVRFVMNNVRWQHGTSPVMSLQTEQVRE